LEKKNHAEKQQYLPDHVNNPIV